MINWQIDPFHCAFLSNNGQSEWSLLGAEHMQLRQQTPSQRIFGFLRQELSSKPLYRLKSNIYQNSSITPNMRARIRSFMMTECCKQGQFRESFVLAAHLVDLYFAIGGVVSVQQFQNMGIAAMILASKITMGKPMTVNFNFFDRNEIFEFEQKIAIKLQYNLTPPTYHQLAERIVYLWQYFIKQNNEFKVNLITKKVQAVQNNGTKSGMFQKRSVAKRLHLFYEQLDCAYMVLKSLDYHIEQLVVNLFYLNVRNLNVPHLSPAFLLQDREFQLAYYPKQCAFRLFFDRFIRFASSRFITLDWELGNYLRNFLNVSTMSPTLKFEQWSDMHERIRFWDKLQSIPKNSYTLAKNVSDRINPMLREERAEEKKKEEFQMRINNKG